MTNGEKAWIDELEKWEEGPDIGPSTNERLARYGFAEEWVDCAVAYACGDYSSERVAIEEKLWKGFIDDFRGQTGKSVAQIDGPVRIRWHRRPRITHSADGGVHSLAATFNIVARMTNEEELALVESWNRGPAMKRLIESLQSGFDRVEYITTDRGPTGEPAVTLALGGPVSEGEQCRLTATSAEFAIEAFKPVFENWLALQTDGRRRGMTLCWREVPNVTCETTRREEWSPQPYVTRWFLWARCLVYPTIPVNPMS